MTLVAHVRCSLGDAEPLLRRVPPFDRLCAPRLELTDTMACAMQHLLERGDALIHVALGQQLPVPAVKECIAPLADALRSSSLIALRCDAARLHIPPEALVVILTALRELPTLDALELWLSRSTLTANGDERLAPGAAAALAALCDLVEANAPALTTLRISNAGLGDEQLVPLLAALEHNTRLRVLDLGDDSTVSSEQAGSALLRAVRAATALRELMVGADEAATAAVDEAQALLQARAA